MPSTANVDNQSLRSFLRMVETDYPQEFLRIRKPVNTRFEMTAIVFELERAGKSPIVIFENPISENPIFGNQIFGNQSANSMPVVTNVAANRTLLAACLGVEPKDLPTAFRERCQKYIPCELVREAASKGGYFTSEKGDVFQGPSEEVTDDNGNTSVNASDPYATREPFTVEYEIEQPKFVDWFKKPVRIPALLPQLGLPDPPAKPAPGAAIAPIDLGTPLEVETHMTLHLPPGTTASLPTGTSVQRDYATFASQYSAKGLTITASRHINFLLRQVPTERATDYTAFLRAVQNDQAQDFTLNRESPAPSPASPPGKP